jgi:hypothetical protein
MDDEIARLMKEAFQGIAGSPANEQENLTRDFAKRLQEESPETAAMIAQARRDGTLLSKLSDIALKSALERPDLSAGDQLEVITVAFDFVDAFGAVCKAPSGLCPLPLAFDLAFKAMFVGLNAGAPPEKIEEARVLGRKAVSRSGGRKNQANRRLRAKEWQAFATAEFKRIRQAKPNITLRSAAQIIAKRWADKFPSMRPVESETVRRFLGMPKA